RGVLVVRVRGDHQQPLGGGQLGQGAVDHRGAAGGGRLLEQRREVDVRRRGAVHQDGRQGENQGERQADGEERGETALIGSHGSVGSADVLSNAQSSRFCPAGWTAARAGP